MKKQQEQVSVIVPPRSAINQLMGLYIIVSFMLATSWLLGTCNCSFLWIFAIIFGLFVVWKTRLRDLVERNLDWHKEHFHRKRALRQEESSEWLNFIVNRWWVFSSLSIEELVKRRINERLCVVKPSFIGNLELVGFTFGDITPSLRCIKAFECADGVPGFKPASWSSVLQPPPGLHTMSEFQIVLEADMASRCDEFRMIFRARAGGEKVGLDFDIAVEELQIKGTLQLVLHMSMEVPFPHVTKATLSFTDLPEVWFNVSVLKALQLMEIPILKSWIHLNVMEGITKALVDPGKIDIPLSKPGPINVEHFIPTTKYKHAAGVLTVALRGTPSPNAGEDVVYTRLRVGKSKRQTSEVPASHAWEDCCSFFVRDLANEKVNIKHKCKRLLTTVTLEQHDLELSSFPFQITKQISHEITNKDGSRINLQMDYSALPPVNLEEEEPINIIQRKFGPAHTYLSDAGVMYVCVHCANNVIATDKTGSSDPYCVVFCDRRRVLTTPYIAQTRNPSWESQTEFFIKDFADCRLSFYVFDWDGTNTLNDDFLGSANFVMSEKEPYVLKKSLSLGCNKQGVGHVADFSLGQIVISVIFRPVPSVSRSERYRLTSTNSANNNNNEFLYTEDMVSPGTVSPLDPSQLGEMCEGGGRKLSKQNSVVVRDDDFMKDKIFVDLTIVQAKDLVAMDRNGYSDPFCEVRIEDVKLFSTSVRKKTLTPKWNESVTLQVNEDCGMVEIQVFDKDLITSNDFLGKVMFTLDQLKEMSLRGTSDWFPLQYTKSGQIQLRCSVTACGMLRKESSLPEADTNQDLSSCGHSDGVKSDQSKPSVSSNISADNNEVFINPENSQRLNQRAPDNNTQNRTIWDRNVIEEYFKDTVMKAPPRKSQSERIPSSRSRSDGNSLTRPPHRETPMTSTPMKQEVDDAVPLRRSASDVNIERRRSHSNSLNSFAAFNDLDASTVLADPDDSNHHLMETLPANTDTDTEYLNDRLYNVSGKVLGLQGMSSTDGNIYCKVRVISPNKHRLRQIFGNRVIAKSPLVKASVPMFNLPIDVDRGMGVNGETKIKFDIKREGKEHVATREYTIKSLFSGPGGEGDKIQKVLPLENNVAIEVFLQHVPVDASSFVIKRRQSSRQSTRSFLK